MKILRPTPQDYDELLTVWEASVRSTHHFLTEENIQGKGYGKQLMQYALHEKHIYKVDVNEQNEKAHRFYLHMGFQLIGRDETDPSGNPFPILHLQWKP